MKNSYTPKVILPIGETSGKAAAPAFAETMNLLKKILTKLGLLKTESPVLCRARASSEGSQVIKDVRKTNIKNG
jgi:hypothetical protein